MPMQYGEGEEAFVHLQKEILRNTNDQTLFAWGPKTRYIEDIVQKKEEDSSLLSSEHATMDPRTGCSPLTQRAFETVAASSSYAIMRPITKSWR
jgi:hypothetical protein